MRSSSLIIADQVEEKEKKKKREKNEQATGFWL